MPHPAAPVHRGALIFQFAIVENLDLSGRYPHYSIRVIDFLRAPVISLK